MLAVGTDPGVFVDWRYRARENRFGRYAHQVRRAGGSSYPPIRTPPASAATGALRSPSADAVEVWNGPWTPDDEIALAEWDNALVTAARNPGDGGDGPGALAPRDGQQRRPPRTGPRATRRPSSWPSRCHGGRSSRGIRAGRSYLAESAALTLSFGATDGRAGTRASGNGCGRRRTLP